MKFSLHEEINKLLDILQFMTVFLNQGASADSQSGCRMTYKYFKIISMT